VNSIRKLASQTATAQVFRSMNSEQERLDVVEQFKSMPDSQLDMVGSYAGISKDHLPLYRKLVRGESNDFTDDLNDFQITLQPGDIILVTGTAVTSKALVKIQKRSYPEAKSSHVIIAQMDFICVDAVPKIGVSPRVIPDLLADVEDGWRVIRFDLLNQNRNEKIMKSCSYYLEQPYRILPSKKPAKNYSYCSELARKIYSDSGITRTGIPQNRIIKPCDFDRIADVSNNWSDVTDQVKPYLDFCLEYTDILKFIAKTYIQGIDLNRKRFKERAEVKKSAIKLRKAGKLTKEAASKIITEINEAESTLNYKFWDYSKR